MERGQRRTSPQSRTGQPQRPAQRPPQRPPQGSPQRRPAQSTRPAQPMRPVNRKRRKNKSKKPWIIGAVVLLLLIIVFGSGGENDSSTIPNPTIEPTAISVDQTPEPQSSEMVDHIIRTAKADASGSDAETKATAAFEWIVQTVPQWYDGPEIMEQAIYNGALVEYYYAGRDDVRSEIGVDVVQSVKYVYRGAETVLDDSTQENIQQIKDGIAKVDGTVPAQAPTQAPTQKPASVDTTTLGERNALASAKNYLEIMSFSYNGLGKQLMYEGYTYEEAKYAVDNCGADWYEQAAKSAASYLETMSFSRQGLIEQLEYEEFTHEQAVYGVSQVGY